MSAVGVRSLCECAELPVKTFRFFQKWHVPHVLIPRCLRRPATLQNVIAHCRQHDDIRTPMRHEHRECHRTKDVPEVEIALYQGPANFRMHQHIRGERSLEGILRDGFHRAGAQQLTTSLCKKHCSGKVLLDNEFVLIERHP